MSPQHCSPIRGSDRQTGSRWRWPGSPRTAPRNRTAPACILSAHPEAAPQLRGFQPLFLRPRQWESAICVRSVNRLDLAPIVPHTQSSSFSPIAQNARTARVFKGRTHVDRSRAVVQPGRSPRRQVSAVVGKVGARRGTPTRPGARGPNDDRRRLPERGFPPGRPRRGRPAKAGRR